MYCSTAKRYRYIYLNFVFEKKIFFYFYHTSYIHTLQWYLYTGTMYYTYFTHNE